MFFFFSDTCFFGARPGRSNDDAGQSEKVVHGKAVSLPVDLLVSDRWRAAAASEYLFLVQSDRCRDGLRPLAEEANARPRKAVDVAVETRAQISAEGTG